MGGVDSRLTYGSTTDFTNVVWDTVDPDYGQTPGATGYLELCDEGYYRDGDDSCAICDEGMKCEARARGSRTAVDNTHWSPTETELQFIVPGGYKSDSPYGAITACDFGYYSAEGDRLCNECTAPHVCSNPALPQGM
jgi:hypothetical protein